jgi:hypothetical protein
VISRTKQFIAHFPLEAFVWLCGIAGLAFVTPGDNHFSICPLKLAGLDFCPGCGLGSSISFLLHGEIIASLKAHPLGIMAFFLLSYRIIELTKNYLKTYGTRN